MSLVDLACSVPWCITDTALDAMLAIAARNPLPAEETARRMHGPSSLALRQGQPRDDSRRMTRRGNVAVIPIDGPIFRYADMFTDISGGVTTESLARDLQTALDDPGVQALLFVIDSPGGEAAGIGELADAIAAARGQKPIVAYIEGYGASAAYWIASAADEVVIDASALVGSIGTVLAVRDPEKVPTTRVEFVATQSPKKRPDPRTEAGRAELQRLVDDLTEVFIGAVMRNRGMTYAQVTAIGGGLLIGQQAIDAGLADQLGSEEGLIRDLQTGVWQAPTQREEPMPAEQKDTTGKPASSSGSGFWAWINGSGTPTNPPDAPQREPAPTATAHTPPATDPAREAEIATLRAQLATVRQAQIDTAAAAFITQELGAGRLLPAEQQAVTALYTRLAQLDAAHPAAEGQPTGVQLLTQAYAARPARQLTQERVASLVPAARGSSDQEAELAAAEAQAQAYAMRANGTGAKAG